MHAWYLEDLRSLFFTGGGAIAFMGGGGGPGAGVGGAGAAKFPS